MSQFHSENVIADLWRENTPSTWTREKFSLTAMKRKRLVVVVIQSMFLLPVAFTRPVREEWKKLCIEQVEMYGMMVEERSGLTVYAKESYYFGITRLPTLECDFTSARDIFLLLQRNCNTSNPWWISLLVILLKIFPFLPIKNICAYITVDKPF